MADGFVAGQPAVRPIEEPETHETASGYWETLSWEEAGKNPADLVMADALAATSTTCWR